jgi:S-DNA-T family DNA segregation ATPase FtsK/SpoIIIE
VQARWRGADPRQLRLAAAEQQDGLDEHCAAVLAVSGPGRAVLLRHPDPLLRGPLRPELVSLVAPGSALARPDRGAELDDLGPARRGGALPALFLTRDGFPHEVDLAADGPHAVVGGTTGSGKSELLTAWALALARASPPSRVALLLLDFKGGTAFDRLVGLPHVAGVVTDLDPAESARAADGLVAELRRREEVLREGGLRSVDDSGLPRLVVVVDEVQALLEGRPQLSAVLTDIASRGRALGVHLVLGGQRPAGVLREALLANCGLRLSLRVLDPADSTAVVGTPGAARLPADSPGAVLVTRVGERPVECRVGRVGSTGTGEAEEARAAPVWLTALTPPMALSELPEAEEGAAVLGRVDRLLERTQPAVAWRPAAEGALLVSGARGSGRTSVLAVAAAGIPGAVVVPGGAADGGERLWDALTSPGDRILLVDDADLALGALGQHAPEAVEMLAARVRRGRAAVAVQGQPPHGLRGTAFGRTLVLRSAKEDAALLGVEPARWSPVRLPGGGWLDGEVFQAAAGPPLPIPDARAPERWCGDEEAVVLSSRPAARLTALREVAGDRVVDLRGDATLPAGGIGVIDPESWHGRPVLWTLPGTLPLVFDGCSLGEYRAVSRRRALPPPLAPGRAWRMPVEGPTDRVLLDPA